ncbi:MAG: hypothetical protein Q8880_02585 [Bacteroidota bacterium]|nr:hypothetical protein [Bacteroidota bacterium]
MGTSSPYGGPNRSPLLPSDFEDGDSSSNNPDPIQNPKENPADRENDPADEPSRNDTEQQDSSNNPQYSDWRQAKNSMSRYAKGGGGRNGAKKAVSDYVKGHGGSHNAAKSAKSGIRTTINIGDFFNNVSKKGISQVLTDYKISTEGKKPKEILNDIINILAPVPDSRENSIAQKALINAMSIIYEMFDDENRDISLLNSIDQDITNKVIIKYIESYLYERLIHDMGSRIETKSANSAEAATIEKELKEYIESKVSTTLEGKPLTKINSETINVKVLVEGLYQQCYKVLEDQL